MFIPPLANKKDQNRKEYMNKEVHFCLDIWQYD